MSEFFTPLPLLSYFYEIRILASLCCHLILFPQDRLDLSATITHENLAKSFLKVSFLTHYTAPKKKKVLKNV